MPPPLRLALAVLAAWGGPLLLSFGCVAIVALTTSGLSAQEVGPWMIGTMWCEAALFASGSLALPFLLPPELTKGAKVLVTLAQALVLQLPTAALLVAANFLVFNR